MRFAEWMATPLGRILRVVGGGVLIWLGLNVVHGVMGTVLALFGIVPITTGLLNLCLIGPLLGAPLRPSPKTPVPPG